MLNFIILYDVVLCCLLRFDFLSYTSYSSSQMKNAKKTQYRRNCLDFPHSFAYYAIGARRKIPRRTDFFPGFCSLSFLFLLIYGAKIFSANLQFHVQISKFCLHFAALFKMSAFPFRMHSEKFYYPITKLSYCLSGPL